MSHADTYDEGGCATQAEVERDRKKDHPYSVCHWGSHPDLDNDDCYTGDDFDTLEEAKASKMYQEAEYSVEYIELDGPDVHELKKNPNYNAKQVRRDRAEQDHLERSEFAMQQGMAFGVQGYNEAMGWEPEDYE